MYVSPGVGQAVYSQIPRLLLVVDGVRYRRWDWCRCWYELTDDGLVDWLIGWLLDWPCAKEREARTKSTTKRTRS